MYVFVPPHIICSLYPIKKELDKRGDENGAQSLRGGRGGLGWGWDILSLNDVLYYVAMALPSIPYFFEHNFSKVNTCISLL